MQLSFVSKGNIGKVECDFYTDANNEIWMTREQIGKALEYKNPSNAIYKIHKQNKEQLDKYSVLTKLMGTDGKMHNTYIYNSKGLFEVCRWIKRPVADQFIDWTWEVLHNYHNGELVILPKNDQICLQRDDLQIEREKLQMEKAHLLLKIADTCSDYLDPTSVTMITSRATEILNSIKSH